jgi:hypothetical protein
MQVRSGEEGAQDQLGRRNRRRTRELQVRKLQCIVPATTKPAAGRDMRALISPSIPAFIIPTQLDVRGRVQRPKLKSQPCQGFHDMPAPLPSTRRARWERKAQPDEPA